MSFFKKKNKIDALTDDDVLSSGADSAEKPTKKSFFSLFHLDRHRVMERRIRRFIIALSVFVIGVGISLYHNHVASIAAMNVATPTNSQVQFSKTLANMTMGKPVLSRDRTTAYIPVSFDDMSNLSTDSNNYHVFIMDASGQALNYRPSGRFVLFGSTGKGAIIVQAPTGITSQMVGIFIRNDKNLNDPDNAPEPAISTDNQAIADAESKYDSLYVTVNPGSAHAKRNAYLNGSAISVKTLYRELFANSDVAAIKSAIRKDRTQLAVFYNQAQEAKRRLVQTGWKVPKNPKWLASDWRPSNSAPVNINGNLRTGLVTGKMTPDAASTSSDGTSETAPDDPSNATFPDSLVNKDGVHSDTVDSSTTDSSDVNAFDPQQTWTDLQSDWTQIGTTKEDIYVTQAMALYGIQQDVDNQTQVASISKASKFTPIGKIEVPTK